MAAISISMVANPQRWSRSIVRFSKWRWFHPFEIASRLLFGLLCVLAADTTRYPRLLNGLGYLLIAVAAGLVLLPPSAHRKFAVWSADRFVSVFRPAGLVTAMFGIFLVYAALK